MPSIRGGSPSKDEILKLIKDIIERNRGNLSEQHFPRNQNHQDLEQIFCKLRNYEIRFEEHVVSKLSGFDLQNI